MMTVTLSLDNLSCENDADPIEEGNSVCHNCGGTHAGHFQLGEYQPHIVW